MVCFLKYSVFGYLELSNIWWYSIKKIKKLNIWVFLNRNTNIWLLNVPLGKGKNVSHCVGGHARAITLQIPTPRTGCLLFKIYKEGDYQFEMIACCFIHIKLSSNPLVVSKIWSSNVKSAWCLSWYIFKY